MRNALRLSLCFVFVVGHADRDCSAGITWNLTYNDVANHTGFGFDDPTQGAARMATVTAVTNYISSVINADGTIDLVVENSLNEGSATLAFAGPLYFPSPNGFANGLVFDHATTGVDPAAGFEDGQATFDFGNNFNSTLAAPAPDQFDLFSITLHEFTHALGFASLVTQDGISAISHGDPGVYSVFDSLLIRGSTGASLFAAGGDFVGTMSDLVSDDVFFDGPNARAANGGNAVQVFAPNPYEDGSSISHLQLPDVVMQFSIAPGVTRRQYSPQDLGILADIGYSIVQPASVPEPSSLVLLTLVGLSYGIGKRRRRLSLLNDTAI
jgi:hypothetical protein